MPFMKGLLAFLLSSTAFAFSPMLHSIHRPSPVALSRKTPDSPWALAPGSPSFFSRADHNGPMAGAGEGCQTTPSSSSSGLVQRAREKTSRLFKTASASGAAQGISSRRLMAAAVAVRRPLASLAVGLAAVAGPLLVPLKPAYASKLTIPIQEKIALEHEAHLAGKLIRNRKYAKLMPAVLLVLFFGGFVVGKLLEKLVSRMDQAVIDEDIEYFGEYIAPDTVELDLEEDEEEDEE